MARSLTTRERMFLAASAGAVFLFVVARFSLIPFVTAEAGMAAAREERLTELRSYQEMAARRPLLESEAEELQRALDDYSKYLIAASTPPLASASLEGHLKEIAAGAGIQVVNEKILPHRGKGVFTEIPVRIVATGTVRNMRDFVLGLERADVLIEIRELNLVPFGGSSKRGGGSEQLRATVEVDGFTTAAAEGEGE